MDIFTLLVILAAGVAAVEFLFKRAQNRAEYEEEVTDRLIAYTFGKAK